MTNRKKVTFSKKKITFHDHGYISDNDYFHEQASDPTQVDHELGEPIDQDYLEEDENEGNQSDDAEDYVPSDYGDKDGEFPFV
jgi:hypothetical protein